jgi:hypothetical protein
MPKYTLFLDDERVYTDVTWVHIPTDRTIVTVRSYDQFVEFVTDHGLPGTVCFDHDLGTEQTGYDCAKWLVYYCLDNQLSFPNYVVHSMNPVGKHNIEQYIENARPHMV